MAFSGSELLSLQANIKKDSEGYRDEFLLQYRHYRACLDIFNLQPANDSREFGDLVLFLAQVCRSYPADTAGFVTELMALLEKHYAVLNPSLRKTLVQALILMRNRHQVEGAVLLPLFFTLFRCHDKALRELLFRHIVADIRNSNLKSRNDKLNRSVQNFLYGILQDDNEQAAKRSLAVLTELWRRHVWRDARTVNVIASAAFHKRSVVMLAVVKFFLGQDDKNEDGEGSDDDKDDGDKDNNVAGPSKEDVYKAYKKGTLSSKKKKQAKLKRVMATVKKQTKRAEDKTNESFAAVHLLHDPQSFVERLFSRMQSGNESFDTRMAMVTLISRVVGTHKLLLLNFYPYLQRYIQPHQRDVTIVLAALVQACHDLVPPETLQPVVRQLVDHFVHDRARPEVMTMGLKTVRELCLRVPLVMNTELLQDLTAYKKFRDKHVSSAARGLIGLFRELAPEMLPKGDRGRGADLTARPREYGAAEVRDRVEGADLLEAAIEAGTDGSGDEAGGGGSSTSDSDEESEEAEQEGSDMDASDVEEEEEDADGAESGEAASDMEQDAATSDREAGGSGDPGSSSDGSDDDMEGASSSGGEDEEIDAAEAATVATADGATPRRSSQLPQQPDSIASLKRKLAEARAADREAKRAKIGGPDHADPGAESAAAVSEVTAAAAGDALAPVVPHVNIEMDRILTEEDFARIRKLKHRRMVEAAMSKHGLKKTSSARAQRLREAAEEEADAALEFEDTRRKIADKRVNPKDLAGRSKWKQDKEERLASVVAGREGREFGSSLGRKKQKTGGLTEREKQKRKALPLAARAAQYKSRKVRHRQKNNPKHFKGHVRG